VDAEKRVEKASPFSTLRSGNVDASAVWAGEMAYFGYFSATGKSDPPSRAEPMPQSTRKTAAARTQKPA